MDARGFFDNDTFSDIIIKTDGREFKCHKMVLYNSGSDYFKALLKPDSAFAEAQQSTIEFKEDSYYAVNVVLRHIYGFEYGVSDDVEGDIAVYAAAQKYMLPELQAKALAAVQKTVAVALDLPTVTDPDARLVFRLLELLVENKHHGDAFTNMADELLAKHTASLMKLYAFRAWLEEEGNPGLDIVVASINTGKQTKSHKTQHSIRVCGSCMKMVVDAPIRHCVNCAIGGRFVSSYCVEYELGKLSLV
ncbi:uncharacterized protein LTR77_000035 [Saxophila tyrrhenica]|uniref:BTB domain-containing protein n=1 Tax=Saxophila tyrrhenica TaxID=1690608 RepID=A0AAV9PLW3_9PEZI|nr:hypothetical protein LTR77_000035 [Saxophila tyrrhenica]